MKIGLFDHVEWGDRPLATLFDERLQFAAAADEAGIWGLHVAEHHATPLNMVPVPGVYLGAVARATKRMRLGPLVYLQRPEQFTLALGLLNLQSQHNGTPWHLLMAASVLVVTPVLILFFLAQKTFIEGIATTGLKG